MPAETVTKLMRLYLAVFAILLAVQTIIGLQLILEVKTINLTLNEAYEEGQRSDP